MNEIVIVGATRLPIGKFGGTLKTLNAVELGTIATQNLLKQTNIDRQKIDNVIFGNVLQAGSGQNVARQIAIKSGLPIETPAMTVNEVCGSSLKAIILGVQALKLNDCSLCLVGGTESMSNAPYYLEKERFGARYGHQIVTDSILKDGLTDAFSNIHMGVTAENIAEFYNISRAQQDEFAYNSHQKAIKNKHVLQQEISPVTLTTKKGEIIINTDENPRFDISLEALSKLNAVFQENGSVTAGNSSSLNDGAAGMLLCTREYAVQHNLSILASIVDYAEVGNDPNYMGVAPFHAVNKLCQKTNLHISDFDCIQSNEAFASQSLAVMNALNLDPTKVNMNGGAIALGHPIGATGTRIVVSLINDLKQTDGNLGLATLCVGGGIGLALAIKNEK